MDFTWFQNKLNSLFTHPNAPAGGGGPGAFKSPRTAGSSAGRSSHVVDPRSPASRHVTDLKKEPPPAEQRRADALDSRDKNAFKPDPKDVSEKVGLDIIKMIDVALRDARGKSGGSCSRYVADAIRQGLTAQAEKNAIWGGASNGTSKLGTDGIGPANGGDMGKKLEDAGFKAMNKPSADFNNTDLQPGDVIVLTQGVGNGHAAIWTGKVWVSDYIQDQSSESGWKNPDVYAHRKNPDQRTKTFQLFRYSDAATPGTTDASSSPPKPGGVPSAVTVPQ